MGDIDNVRRLNLLQSWNGMQKISGMSVKENLEKCLRKNVGVEVEWKEVEPFWVAEEKAHKGEVELATLSVHLCMCRGRSLQSSREKKCLKFHLKYPIITTTNT